MDVLFAVLPFTDIEHPAIGASLLHAQIDRLGLSSRVRYFTFDLAERIGLDLYQWLSLCGNRPALGTSAPAESLIGEWFFADLLFGDEIPRAEDYVAEFLTSANNESDLVGRMLAARRCRQAFLDHCVAEIESLAPRVVGFTTSFHQTCASLLVASQLKQSSSPPIIVFGGANCTGEMGLQMIRSFPWIDYVCTGEGDAVFPELVERLLRGGDERCIPGIVGRNGDSGVHPGPLTRAMDELPYPDYSGYFADLRRSSLHDRMEPRLLVETSRGCWWGEKHHCIFCGLNGETMAYRSKSARRVVSELSHLADAYQINRFDCVDNILDPRHIRTVFPELIDKGPRLELFYATKSNLTYEQVRLLAMGGVRTIQPGIESFSTEILRLMRKGCTGLQNICILRWCKELGISVAWNILYGFPGEPASEYEPMTELLPLLTHLDPPAFCAPARMDRFSPMFTSAEQFGLRRSGAAPAYSYVYPLGASELANLAFYCEFEYVDQRQPAGYVGGVVREAETWASLHHKGRVGLDAFQASSVLLINDTRPCASKQTHILTGDAAQLYLFCDTPQKITSLAAQFGENAARETLASLVASKLTVELDQHYLSLAVLRTRGAFLLLRDTESAMRQAASRAC